MPKEINYGISLIKVNFEMTSRNIQFSIKQEENPYYALIFNNKI